MTDNGISAPLHETQSKKSPALIGDGKVMMAAFSLINPSHRVIYRAELLDRRNPLSCIAQFMCYATIEQEGLSSDIESPRDYMLKAHSRINLLNRNAKDMELQCHGNPFSFFLCCVFFRFTIQIIKHGFLL